MIKVFLTLLSAVTVFLLVISFGGGESRKSRVKKRLSKLSVGDNLDNVHKTVMREKRKAEKMKLETSLVSKKFADYLFASGIKLRATEFLTMWICITIIPASILAFMGKSFITILGAGIIGLVIPPFMVRRAKKKRQQLFHKQLGEALVVIVNCIKSGYSFQQSLESVALDMQPPISNEFSLVLNEIKLGISMEDALAHMVKRTDNPDLGILVSAVVTSSQVGANLSEILDNIALTIKDRIKIRDEVQVLTAQGRMSGIVIGLLPVAIVLMMMLVNPDFINSFFTNTLGRILIGIGVVMEIIGFLVIRKVVDIKY